MAGPHEESAGLRTARVVMSSGLGGEEQNNKRWSQCDTALGVKGREDSISTRSLYGDAE